MEHTVKKNNQALLHVGRQSDLALFLKPAICHFKSNYLWPHVQLITALVRSLRIKYSSLFSGPAFLSLILLLPL